MVVGDIHGGRYYNRGLTYVCTRGVSVHMVTAALDDGPLIAQAKLTVRADDTEQTLSDRVLKCEHQLYPAVISAISEGALFLHTQTVIWNDASRLAAVSAGTITFPKLN